MRTRWIMIGMATLTLGASGAWPGLSRESTLADFIPEGREGCRYGRETPIPDAKRAGVRLGPITLPESETSIQGLCLGLEIEHEFIADLRIELGYDRDRDGTCEIVVPLELYTLRESHEAKAEMVYPFCLDGVYFFRDDASTEDLAPPVMRAAEPGCSSGQPIRDFAVFQGQRTGGDFYLTVADTLATRTGILRDWAVGLRQ